MVGNAAVWEDLQRRGFGAEHLRLLHALLASTRNGQWSVHCVGGRVSSIDLRVVTPPHTGEMTRWEAWVSESLASGAGVDAP